MTSRPVRPQELRGSPRLRSTELPRETLVLLRGAPLSVDELVEQAADSGRRYTLDGQPFFALSLSAVIDGRTEAELLAEPPLAGYPKYHRMRAGDLYIAGFALWATFRRPEHFDVRPNAATRAAVRRLIAVAGPLLDNRHYEY